MRTKKAEIVAVSLIVLILVGAFITVFSFMGFTGKAVSQESSTIEPNAEEQTCIRSCAAAFNCTEPGDACVSLIGNKCITQCNVVKPEQNQNESISTEKDLEAEEIIEPEINSEVMPETTKDSEKITYLIPLLRALIKR